MNDNQIKHLFAGKTPNAALIKDAIARKTSALHAEHRSSCSAETLINDYTSFIDEFLIALFDNLASEFNLKESVALLAVGGYGRGELNIHSDIDLNLLYKKKLTPGIEALTEKMLYILWDTGLDVGFSIRSIKECLKLADEDTKTMTSLLDVRLLTGDATLLNELEKGFNKKLLTISKLKTFLTEKVAETTERHEKFGGSIYILEPNIKEGDGGLRDIHTAKWIIQAKNKIKCPEDLIKEILSSEDYKLLTDAFDFLLWVRNDIHLNTGRKGDQLTFDHQERIASELGYKNTDEGLGVEIFMQKYYRHASRISRLSKILVSTSIEDHISEARKGEKPLALDENYTLRGTEISANTPEDFANDPKIMMKAFEYLMGDDYLLAPDTRDAIMKNAHRIDDDFRSSPEITASFMKMIKGRNPFKPLAEMHRLKFLGRFIPEFKNVIYRVQHDRYHVYTVDVHTLFAIREMERLYGVYKNEHYLLASILEEIERPELLVLGILLHDIGKAYGKGHAEKGAEMAPKILSRLGLDEKAIKTVVFLVREHLIIADTAQYRDIHDPKLIIDFARTVKSIERMKMLLVLTFADVRAVGPDVWSQWKGALFQELFFKVIPLLERGTFDYESIQEQIVNSHLGVLKIVGEIDNAVIDNYFSLLPPRYLMSNDAARIAYHIGILEKLDPDHTTIIDIREDTEGESTELAICTYDVAGLFSMITGVMAANSTNILTAEVNTLKNGYVLDIFHVKNAFGEALTDEGKIRSIKSDLSKVISGTIHVDKLVARQRPSILDNKPTPQVPTHIEIDNEVSDKYTVIDIHTEDRIGLLYKISSELTRLGVYIVIAKISTKGDAATDIFYVNDIFGQKIFFDKRLNEIVEALYQTLDGNAKKSDATDKWLVGEGAEGHEF